MLKRNELRYMLENLAYCSRGDDVRNIQGQVEKYVNVIMDLVEEKEADK